MNKLLFRLLVALSLCLPFQLFSNVSTGNLENIEKLTNKSLTIKNRGNCTIRVYEWLPSGDIYKTTLTPGQSWTVSTPQGRMWRVIENDATPNWNNLAYDEHYTVTSSAAQTWEVFPDYCCSKQLTIQNRGVCAIRIYKWIPSGDVYFTTIQPGGNWTVTTCEARMWRAIENDATPNWSNLAFDEHYTATSANTQTWTLYPRYCCTFTAANVVCEASINNAAWAALTSCAVTVCEGAKVQLSVNPNGATSYEWTGPNGFSANGNANGDILVSNAITTAQGGVYTVKVTQNGCIATKTITVTVIPRSEGGTLAANASAVCASTSNFPAGFFRLSGQRGTIVRWEWSTNGTTWNNWGGAGSATSPAGYINDAATFSVRVLVKNSTCTEDYSAVRTVRVDAASEGGTLAANASAVCASTSNFPASFFRLSGQRGAVVRWEWSTNGTTWNNWGGAGSATSPAGNINYAATFSVRVLVKNGACNEDYSAVKTVRVDAPSVGGTVSPASQTISITANGVVPTRHSLSGHVGSIVRWEYQRPNETTWNTWNGAGTSNPAAANCCFNEIGTWKVRVVLKNGTCGEVVSSISTIIVTQDPCVTNPSEGGTLAANATAVCASTSNFPAGFFRLSGQRGTIVRWEWSTNGTTWNNWGGAGSVTSPAGHINSAATFYVRVVVKNGTCNEDYSAVKTVRVDAVSVGGTVSPASQAISMTANGVVPTRHSLSGQVGNIVRWEFLRPNETTWNTWNAAGTSNPVAVNCCFNTVGTWKVRAIVKNGTCNEDESSIALVIVTQDPCVIAPSVGGTVSPASQTISITANGVVPTRHSLSGQVGNVVRWEYQRPNATTWTAWAGTATTAPANNIFTTLGTWKVRAIVKNNTCNEDESSIALVIVTQDPCVIAPSVGGTVSPASQTISITANGVVPTRHSLSGQVGNVVRWEYQRPNATSWTLWAGTATTAPANNIFTTVGTWKVRAIVKNNTCNEDESSIALVIVTQDPCVIAPSVGGTVSPASQTISMTANGVVPTRHTLSGQVGNVVRWEFLRPNSTTWENWGGAGSTTAPSNCCFNILGTWKVRAIVKNNTCNEDESSIALVIVTQDPCVIAPSVGGTVSPASQTISITANGVVPTRHSLSGQVGNVVRWEYQRPNETTWTAWAGTATTAPANNIFTTLGTWKVRAIVKNNTCNEDESSIALVIVTQDPCVIAPSVGGTVSPASQTITTAANGVVPTRHSLSGQVGNVVRWEYQRPNETTWTTWAGTATTAPANNIFTTVGTWKVRAIVKNNTCVEATSSVANVIVTQAPPTDDCESVTVRAGSGSIIFGNISTTQRAFIKVYSMTWQLLYTCNENCGPNLTVPNLSTGRYIVHIQYLSQSWQAVCNRLLEIDVIGGTVDCNVNRDNTITKSCVNGQVVLTGTDLPGFEYMWLKGTSSCPSDASQAIAGATGRNYTLPSSPTATTYYSRCARPIGCTTWGAITESNCITVNANECNTPNGGCESVIVEGKNNGTICISGMGTYTSQILIFNNQWQPVHNQQYNQNSTCVPLKNGIYQVKVQLYNTNGTWQFICEKMFTATVTGSPEGLVGKDEQFLMTASLENNRARIEYLNNTGSENDYFEVEKLNLQTGAFEVMETVNARQTDKLEQYSSYDNTLVQGENTYKVTLVKHNGSRRSTAPQTLYYNRSADIALYPNPATDYVELDLKAYENQAVTIQIMNVFGTVEYSQKLDKVTKEPIHINLDNLASGQYMIQITTEKQKPVVKKITVQK